MSLIPNTDLDVYPLCLGGNVFGWTADEEQSFAVLDAYWEAGGNFIDTADSYSAFVPGHTGGESERILGSWLARRDARSSIVLATKVGRAPNRKGLAADNIRAALEDSLARLRTDYVDLYYAHADDPDTPIEETMGAFDQLVQEGKVRYVAASNYTAPRLAEAIAVSEREDLVRYVALEPHYNLVVRDEYEGELAELCDREELACVPYWGLAMGFLTGKYRPGGAGVQSARAARAGRFLDERGQAVLTALDRVSATHDVPVASVALAWLLAQPTVVAPIASARTPQQLAELLPAVDLGLGEEDLASLSAASQPAVA
ncbi:MAG TPA: aldo/keto reductase [Solirubrobacteraceae bacterium]|nr:aldo/keto reductase [Solirubrobacteraceae bacterium]